MILISVYASSHLILWLSPLLFFFFGVFFFFFFSPESLRPGLLV